MSAVAPPRSSNMAFVDGSVDVAVGEVVSPAGTATNASPTSFVGKVQYYYTYTVEGTRRRMAMMRPWKEFFDREGFAMPSGLSESLSRLNRNINFYYHNYVILAMLCSSYILLLNLSFSICLFLTMAMWWYVNAKRLEAAETNANHFTLYNRSITFSQAYLFIMVFGGIAFFLSNGSSVVFWLLLSSVGVVTLHATMRKPTSEEQPFSFV